MALIRGPKGKCPCPICTIPIDKLSDLRAVYPLRTTEGTQQKVRAVIGKKLTKARREAILKPEGLRPVIVSR